MPGAKEYKGCFTNQRHSGGSEWSCTSKELPGPRREGAGSADLNGAALAVAQKGDVCGEPVLTGVQMSRTC